MGVVEQLEDPPLVRPTKATSADLNLLFAFLAMQMNFIERDGLVQAMSVWVLDKTRPLADILIEKGFLTRERHAILEPLVQEYLKDNDNDPEKSLAAVGAVTISVNYLREQLGHLGDVDIESSLTRFAPPPGQLDAMQTLQSPHASSIGDYPTGSRFRVLRPHAKGGLGQVSVAKDDELNREVALKEIQSRYADDQVSRSRFMLEAEITGGLEHPGVVPVYGLGSYSDGRPYYAMRFIRGDNLKDAISRHHGDKDAKRDPGEQSLEFRKMLSRFINVCMAMEYAHSRQVLHRDIKPGNIMLGKYGETMLVDWGMAKVIDPQQQNVTLDLDQTPITPSISKDIVATSMGSTVGTPSYMSPEQAAGRLDQLGPLSDIYGLGATLFHLLTGRPPFRDRDVGSVLKRVMSGDFEPPRKLDPSVSQPLEAICLKAMALRLDDRYQSARALAEDIEHWLADEPVTAMPESFLQRVARWFRRHKTWTQAIAVTLVLVSAVSTVAALVVNEARKKERVAQEAERMAKEEEQAAKEDAQEQRDFAIHRLQEQRQAINRWVVGGADALNQHWLFKDYREQHLEMAIRDLQSLTEQQINFTDLEIERGRVFKDLANVQRLAGRMDKAEDSYGQAFSLFQRYPENLTAQLELAQTHTHLGLLFSELNKRTAAESSYHKSLEILQPHIQDMPDQFAFSDTLGETLLGLGSLYHDGGSLQKAVDVLRRAIKELDGLVGRSQRDGEYVVALCRARLILGKVFRDQGHTSDALRQYDQALDDCTRLVDKLLQEDATRKREFEYLNAQDVLAAANELRAAVLGKMGRTKAQIQAYKLAIRSYMDLSTVRAHMRRYKENQVVARYNHAMALYRSGDTEQAESDLRKVVVDFQILEQIYDLPIYKERKATAIDATGVVFGDQGDDPNAVKTHRMAIATFSLLAQNNDDIPRYRQRMAVAHSHLGHALHKLDEIDAAKEELVTAVRSLEKLIEQQPNLHHLYDELAFAYQNLGVLHFDQGDEPAARTAFGQARQNWERIATGDNVPSLDYLDHLAKLLLMCPVEDLRDPATARRHVQRAHDAAPENAFFCATLGVCEYREENWEEAANWLQKTIDLREARPMGRDSFFLAMTLWQQAKGPSEEAERRFQEAIAWTGQHRPGNMELRQIRDEAKRLRGQFRPPNPARNDKSGESKN